MTTPDEPRKNLELIRDTLDAVYRANKALIAIDDPRTNQVLADLYKAQPKLLRAHKRLISEIAKLGPRKETK